MGKYEGVRKGIVIVVMFASESEALERCNWFIYTTYCSEYVVVALGRRFYRSKIIMLYSNQIVFRTKSI